MNLLKFRKVSNFYSLLFFALMMFQTSAYAVLMCGSGTCSGYACDSGPTAKAKCEEIAAQSGGGACTPYGTQCGWKYYMATYYFGGCACPDGGVVDKTDPCNWTCGGGGSESCESNSGTPVSGTWGYNAETACQSMPTKQVGSDYCGLTCTNVATITGSQRVASGCSYNGGIACVAVSGGTGCAGGACEIGVTESVNPQDCGSGKVTNLEWDESIQRCVTDCNDDFIGCVIDNAEYWYDECAEEALSGAMYGGTLGGVIKGKMGGLSAIVRGAGVAMSIGGAVGGAMSSIVCMTGNPTPQQNCNTQYFIRTATDCVLKSNPTADPNIYQDPSTGLGTKCPMGMVEDARIGICVEAGYQLPTESQMQDAEARGITNPRRAEPCPLNTHETNGLCYKNDGSGLYDDNDPDYLQDEAVTQGGDNYHVWVDNFHEIEFYLSSMRGSLIDIKEEGVIHTGHLSAIRNALEGLENQTQECGVAGKPECFVHDSEVIANTATTNTKLDTLNTTNTAIKTNTATTNTKLDTLNANLTATKTEITGVKTNTATTNTKLDTLNTTNTGIKTEATAIKTNTATTNTKLDTLNTTNTEIKTEATAIKDNTTAMNEKVGLLKEQFDEFLRQYEENEEDNCTSQPFLTSSLINWSECKVEDVNANEKLEKLVEFVESLQEEADEYRSKSEQITNETRQELSSTQEQQESQKQQAQQVQDSVVSQANNSGDYFATWTMSGFGQSVSVPFRNWLLAFTDILPLNSLRDLQCSFNHSFTIGMLGVSKTVSFNNGIFNLCDIFAPVKLILSWFLSVFGLFKVMDIIIKGIVGSQDLMAQAMVAPVNIPPSTVVPSSG